MITSHKKCFPLGSNLYGQLGLGYGSYENNPEEVVLCKSENEYILSVTCGAYYSVVLIKSDFKTKCYVWGQNQYGQLGLGDRNNQYWPTELMIKDATSEHCSAYENIMDVSCGENHTMALVQNGYLYGWGHNESGQLGIGFKSIRHSIPTKIELSRVISVSCGNEHTVALTAGGIVYVWGRSLSLGLGTSDNGHCYCTPQKLEFNKFIVSVNCGFNHTIIVTSDHKIYGWGGNCSRQLMTTRESYVLSPIELVIY